MAQKFITKKNRHLFRRPIKAKVEEKVVVELPVHREYEPQPTAKEILENFIVKPEEVAAEIVTETPKKKKAVKKIKEVEEKKEEQDIE